MYCFIYSKKLLISPYRKLEQFFKDFIDIFCNFDSLLPPTRNKSAQLIIFQFEVKRPLSPLLLLIKSKSNVESLNQKRKDTIKPNRPPKNAICLNPSCKSSRLFSLQISKNQSIMHEDHMTCKNWLYDIEDLRYKFNDSNTREINMQSFSLDYFGNTIDSIYMAQCLNDNDWQTSLLKYYDQLKKKIDQYVTENLYQTQNQIRKHVKVNRGVSNQIFRFCENVGIKDRKQIEEIYNKSLKESLEKMKKIGYLSFENNGLKNTVNQIINSLKQIDISIWSKQLASQLENRILSQTQFTQFKTKIKDLNPFQINQQIQKIQNSYTTRLQYKQSENEVSITCFLCKKQLKSNAAKVKQRKLQSRINIVYHIYNSHSDSALQRLSKAKPLLVSLAQFKRQVIAKNPKQIILIDRENVGHITASDYFFPPEVYCLEIVSLNSEHLAKSKYIRADSKGKDAADMLAVIVICEISHLKINEVLLITKDHFATTLKPILSSLGTSIKTSASGEQLQKYKTL